MISHKFWKIYFSDNDNKNHHLRSQDVAAMGVLSSKMKQKYEMGIKNDLENCYTKVSNVTHRDHV